MKKRYFILLVCAAVIFSASGLASAGVAKIGHRGARALEDENTLESLKLAVELGVDMLEFDIHHTRDGVFVLMHDDTVDRTTDGTGRVDEMDLAEFKLLKTGRGYTPPTLEEVLTWLNTQSVMFILDCKITDPEEAKKLISLVESHGLIERAIFESPIPAVAGLIESLRPEVVTAVYPTNMPGMRYYLKKYEIDYASYLYYFANPLEVWLVKRSGKKVMVWTVDSRMWIHWFEKLKVDGIMTDDPHLFKP